MTGWLDDIIGAEVRNNGTALTTPQRRILNLQGGAVATDNPTTRSIDIDMSGVPTTHERSVGVYRPESYGAVGDGTHDDTAAIQAAIDAAEAIDSGVVALSPVTYKTTAALTVEKPITVVGCGLETEVAASGAHYGFIVGGPTAFWGGSLQDLLITGTATGKAGVRIGADDATPTGTPCQFLFRGVHVSGFTGAAAGHTVQATSAAAAGGCGFFDFLSVQAHFVDCYAHDNYRGYFESAGDESTTATFDNCSFRENTIEGAYLRSASSYTFRSCVFESNYGEGLRAASPAAPLNGINGLTLDGCHFENNCRTVGTYECVLGDGQEIRSTRVRDCTLNFAAGKKGIWIDKGRECVVENPWGTLTAEMVTTTNSTSVVVIGGADDAPANVCDSDTIQIRHSATDGRLYDVSGNLRHRMGDGTGEMRCDGTLYSSNATVATEADMVEKTLGSYTLPANSIMAAGHGVIIEAWFMFAANGDAKTVKIKDNAGNVIIQNLVTAAPNDKLGKLRVVAVNHGGGLLIYNGEGIIGAAPEACTRGADAAFNAAAGYTFTVTGQNGAANAGDIYLTQLHVQSLNYH